MSDAAARRLVQALSDHVMARESLIAALPPHSTITITVKTDAAGLPKRDAVTFTTITGPGMDVAKRTSSPYRNGDR